MSKVKDAYLDAKVSYEVLEQQIKACQDTRLLPGLNHLLEQSAIAVEDKFHAWSTEVDELLNQPVVEEIPVTRHLAVVGWYQADDINQTPGVA